MKGCPLQLLFLQGGALFCIFLACEPTAAQIVPDATLPSNSIVTPQGNTSLIEGGTRAGGNLFHSFQEFSVPTNTEAFFNNALDIQNIFSRVTGNSISNIDGLIRANGAANLFLLNPNGIIFGPNARLNIGGSFLASTANSLRFADGTSFSTTNPQTAPLLTISVPVGLQMGPNPGNIVVQGPGNNLSYAPETGAIIRDNRPVGLQVAPGQTLALLGGNIALEGGNLTAESGRIELGSVGGETLVTLTPMNSGMALSYPEIQNFQDISLSKAASVDVSGAGGGNVFVVGRRVTLTDGSAILSLTEGAASGGTLSVRASEVVEAIGSIPDGQFPSGLFALVQPDATGNGGNLTIETTRLQIVNGAQVGTGTFGSGKAGSLTVKAEDTVEAIGTSADGQAASALSASVQPGATGDGGNLTIETTRLRVAGGAQVSTGTRGSGKAGNLTVKASDTVELIGTSANIQFASGLFAPVDVGVTGDGGNLTIETTRLRVTDGAQVSTGTFGSGKAGNLTVKASDTVELIGESADGRAASGLFAQVIPGATGDGGNLIIETTRLRLVNGAQVSVSTFGSGKAGNLTVKAGDTVELIGISVDGKSASALGASVQPGATGDGGNLTIETDRLRVADGAQVATATRGFGNAGDLTVKAGDTVELIGTSADGQAPSGLRTSVEPGATGDGGNLTIETDRLLVANGAQVGTGTRGFGNAGDLTVKASDTVELIAISANGDFPSALAASVAPGATGNGGNLTIETAHLRVADGAIATVRNVGEGKAGNLIVDADSIRLENSGSLTADTKAGGGSIKLRSPSITLRRGSSITTNAQGGESGGDIDVQASSLILRQNSTITTNAQGSLTGTEIKGGNISLDADVIAALENSDISANSDNFFGGRVSINAQAIFGSQFRSALTPESDITATGGAPEFSGTVEINTPDVDPTSGLIELPANLVDATNQFVSACPTGTRFANNEFFITGRGGIPPNPREALSNNAIGVDWVTLSQEQGSRGAGGQGGRGVEHQNSRYPQYPVPSTQFPISGRQGSNTPAEIVEANGWVIGANGEVILTANLPNATPYQNWHWSETCPEMRSNN